MVASQNVGCFLSLTCSCCPFFTDALEPYSLCIMSSHVFQYCLLCKIHCIYCRMLTGAQNTFVYRNMHHGILAVRENIQVLHLTPVCRAAQLFIVQSGCKECPFYSMY